MTLHNQDRDKTYEYTGQALYIVPVPSPYDAPWGFNLHLDGVQEFIGTFDSAEEATAEMEAISASETHEHYVAGHISYNGDGDFEKLRAFMYAIKGGK